MASGHSQPGRRSRRARSQAAFSLVEIMVVLVIIGLLAGVVTLSVRSYMVSARQNTARTEISRIADALDTYYVTHGQYPSNDEGLSMLRETSNRLPEPLLRQDPVDPWGRPYQYNRPGRDGAAYEVFTLGANGREGGEGADREIGTWNLRERDEAEF